MMLSSSLDQTVDKDARDCLLRRQPAAAAILISESILYLSILYFIVDSIPDPKPKP